MRDHRNVVDARDAGFRAIDHGRRRGRRFTKRRYNIIIIIITIMWLL